MDTAFSASAFVGNVLGFYITAVLLYYFSNVARFTDADVVTNGARRPVYDVRELFIHKFVFHRAHSVLELARWHVSDVDFMHPRRIPDELSLTLGKNGTEIFAPSPCYDDIRSDLALELP
ncbi:hypothetical protein MRX96_026766 [Rhipicephalus microplus]